MDPREQRTRSISGGLVALIVVVLVGIAALIAWSVLRDEEVDVDVERESTATASPDDEVTDAAGIDTEPEGDPPDHAAVADLVDASITQEGDTLVFAATLAQDVPSDMQGEQLQLKWRVFDLESRPLWEVTGVYVAAAEAILNEVVGDQDFATTDGSFPGDVSLDGDSFTITLDTSELAGFPESFTWALGARVDDPDDPDEHVATDRFPEEGFALFPG